METLRYWAKGVRLYIAITSLLLTGLTISWSHTLYGGTTLYATRIEEVFAWLALGLVTLAIAIGPVCKLFSTLPGRQVLFDARRLLGVSAAWFATLHAGIAYFVLFKHVNPFTLPGMYQRSFLAGGIALVILLAMAFTSFDAAFSRMGIWWHRLHRFVYVAILFIVLHAFMTGVHAAQPAVLAAVAAVGILFIVLYGSIIVMKKGGNTRLQTVTVALMAILLMTIVAYGVHQHSLQSREAQAKVAG